MYEALADSMLKRIGQSEEKLRRAETQFLLERSNATKPEAREGLELVLRRLRERLAQWPELPLTGSGK